MIFTVFRSDPDGKKISITTLNESVHFKFSVKLLDTKVKNVFFNSWTLQVKVFFSHILKNINLLIFPKIQDS